MRFSTDRSSLVLTAVFFVGLEAITMVSEWYWPLFTTCMILLVVGTLIAQMHEVRARGWHVLSLPLAYIGSVFLFHLFISRGIFQHIFILLATIGFFLLVARGIEWAYPTWNWFFTSATFFLFTAGMNGLSFHLRFPLWAVVLSVGTLTFLLSAHVIGRANISLRRWLFWNMLLTLLVSEILIALALLPLSYLVVSGTLFVVFYVVLHLLQRYLYDRLTPRLVSEYIVLTSVAVSLMLGTARWAVL